MLNAQEFQLKDVYLRKMKKCDGEAGSLLART